MGLLWWLGSGPIGRGRHLEALAKGDVAAAGELLTDRQAYEGYQARMAGERYAAPVKVAKAAGPDHRAAIAGDDYAELERLVHLPEGRRQYDELLRAGELAGAAEQAVAKRAQTPDQVPAAEFARWRERIRDLLKSRDQKGLDAARREGVAAFQAVWVAMSVAGERMTM
jgi:hypothetical protein